MSFTVISQIYIVSTLVGSGFMLLSTAIGGMRHGGGHHGGGHAHGGHGGVGHGGAGHGGMGHSATGHGAAGHGSGLKAIGHGGAAGHSAAGGHNVAGHGATGHAAASGHSGAAGHSANAGHSGAAAHHANAAHGSTGHGGAAAHAASIDGPATTTGPVVTEPSGIITRALGKVHGLHVELKEESFLEVILGFLNPMSIATFLTFFGVCGFIASVAFNFPVFISLPVAVVSGWSAVQIMIHVIAWLFENLGSSSEAKMADLVGRMAEVTLPIGEGKLGEVTYIVKSKRYSSPAKSVDPALALTKRSKVMISEVADYVVLVEPWTDSFIDPDFDSPAVH